MKKRNTLKGDEYGEWLDSKLTPLGKTDVSNTGKEVLLLMIQDLEILPQKFFSSPMRRCLETFIGSWDYVFEKFPELINKEKNIESQNVQKSARNI